MTMLQRVLGRMGGFGVLLVCTAAASLVAASAAAAACDQ